MPIDYRDEAQVRLLGELRRFAPEYDAFQRTPDKPGYYLTNGMFGSVDAELLYAMIRHTKPKKIVEVGAGWSSLLILMAIDMNRQEGHNTQYDIVSPVVPDYVPGGSGGNIRMGRLEDHTPLLDSLKANDMVVGDTSHVVMHEPDFRNEITVMVEYMQKATGVIFHFHDIFLPDGYPEQWAARGYNEQGYLDLFLQTRDDQRVLLANNWLHKNHPDLLAEAVASYDPERPIGPGSFWVQKTPSIPGPVTPKVKKTVKRTITADAEMAPPK